MNPEICLFHHYLNTAETNNVAANIAASTARPGTPPAKCIAPLLPLLVLLIFFVRCEPALPLDVARAEEGTVAVFIVFVTAVVGKVCVLDGVLSSKAPSERKTSAKPGAGTVTKQVFVVCSQLTVWTSSSPEKRPSTSNRFPNVYIMTSVPDFRMIYTMAEAYLSRPCDVLLDGDRFCR